MTARAILPRLTGFRLQNFQPIFTEDIDVSLSDGYTIVLGGNAMGKTTLMQAVVYGLTGGSESFEADKRHRWSHSYFRGRLAAGNAKAGLVEVDFSFGERRFSVRRSVGGDAITGFRIGSHTSKWIEDRNDAQVAFEHSILTHGGYASISDFAFVIHRLLYLPESRRLLAWDTEAQLRILIILNQDLAPERSFETRRKSLQLLDTKKRHTRVAINKADKELSTLMEFDESADVDEDVADVQPVTDESTAALASAMRDLQTIGAERARAERDADKATALLNTISTDTEQLQEKIDHEESILVLHLLGEQERDRQLALQKLIDLGICPACGTQQAALQALALEHLRRHGCAICGAAMPLDESGTLATLRSRLSEKLAAQQSLQDARALTHNRVNQLRSEENAAQRRVNELRFSQPVVALAERHLPLQSRQDLAALKSSLEQQELDLAAQIQQLTTELETEYETFRTSMAARSEELARLYTDYATEFLGLHCDLVESASSDNFLNLHLFVPRFEGITRDTPESCSEAQRFFLDIAFRMALIDLACRLSTHTSSFLCETPESALDLSYLDNVVTMFVRFADQRHTILLTANVQRQGVAELLLIRLPMRNRSRRFLNLFKIGRLSLVQQSNRKKIDAALRAIAIRKVTR